MGLFRVDNIVEDIKSALSAVLNQYFLTEDYIIINGTQKAFPACNIYYDITVLNNIDNTSDIFAKPVIAITGNRMTKARGLDTIKADGKCQTDIGQKTFIDISEFTRTVYVKCVNKYPLTFPGLNLGDDPFQVNHKEYCDKLWGLLYLVFNTQESKFAAENLYSVNLSASPIEYSTIHETVLSGQLKFTAHLERIIE